MTFSRFVEIGRVAYVAFGPDAGKIVVIIDVLDQNRVFVDGPCSGVIRKSLNLKTLQLTPIVMNITRSMRTGLIKKAWEKEEVTKKWEESAWAKKITQREKRANLTDFDRFKLMRAKQQRNRLVNIQFGKLRKAGKTKAKK
uniref:Large ribosomal subunit protein eL14 n=1 Tax=Phragmatopoma lapidosa TaxID=341668 RepID=A0A0A0R3D4_9ANNE|nr:60S ribosomal protein [Phragmatopoma lapidosa]